jgi:chemotaxis regulatin CheY-phosphate phosphatase CheZ
MNELLEAKLTINRIKTQLLDLAGELIAVDLTDKGYSIKRILEVVEHIERHDVEVKEIVEALVIKSRII